MEKLRLLLLEDMITDAEIVLRTLKRSGMDFDYVLTHNEEAFVKALEENQFDAILADNSLPQFSASEALKIIKSKKITIPFILVTGSISEDYAVKIMKEGAWDYILKDRLVRLPNSVLGAIEKYKLEEERRRYLDEVIANEALLKEAARLAHFGSWDLDLTNNIMRWSDEKYSILGYKVVEITPSIESFLRCVHPDDVNFVRQTIEQTIDHLGHNKYYCRIVNKEGSVKHIYSEIAVKRDESNKAVSVNGFIIDVSDLKEAEIKEKKIAADLVQRNQDLEQFAYIISHNLRSPVANIVGVSNALLEGDLDGEEHIEFMHALSASVKKLDDVILDLNYILQVRHHVNENKEWVNFPKMVENIKFNIASLLDEKGVMILSDFSEVEGIFSIRSYMHSIFFNLISNSIKFSQLHLAPVMEIKSSRQGDKIILTFKDNGIGIDLTKKSNQVFGLYKRFHPTYAEGKGMGLFMVKTQVETVGGKISVQSEVNKGTEFTIEFNIAEHEN